MWSSGSKPRLAMPQGRGQGRAGAGQLAACRQGGHHVSVLQSEGVSLQATSCSEELQCCQSEVLELRRTVDALEVERQAQHSLVRALLPPSPACRRPAC